MAINSRTMNLAMGWFLIIVLGCLGLPACSQKNVDTVSPTFPAEPEVTPSPEGFYYFTLENESGNGIVEAADWASDGNTFALATSLGVDIYDAQTLEIVTRLDTGQWNQEIAYSPDGKVLAIGGKDNIIQLWNSQSLELIHSLVSTGPEPYYGNSLSFSFSQDGQKLISTHYQTAYLWDVPTGELIESFPGHADAVYSVVLSPDEKTYVAAGSRQIFVRDVASRELLYPPIQLTEDITSVYFAPDGAEFFTIQDKWIYINSYMSDYYESTIRRWNLSSGKMLDEYQIGIEQIEATDFNPDTHVFILGEETGFRIWDYLSREEVLSLSKKTSSLSSVSLSPDGQRLITVGTDFGNGLTQVWDLTTRQVIRTFDQYSLPSFGFALSPDEKLAATSYRNRTTRVLDAKSGRILYTLDGGTPLAFSPGSETVAYTAGFDRLVLANARNGENSSIPSMPCPGLKAIAFNPDRKTMAIGGDSCDLQIRDAHTGKLVKNLSRVPGNEYLSFDNISYSPDGKMLVLFGYRLKIIDAQTGETILEDDTGYGDHKIAFSPDGRYLAVSGYGGYSGRDVIQVRDVRSQQIVLSISTLQDDIRSLTFGADNRTLMIVGESIEFWDLWGRQPLTDVKLTENPPAGVALLQNGRELLLVNDRGELQHWSFLPNPQLTLGIQPTPTDIPTLTATPDVPEIELTQIAEVGKGYGSRINYSPDGTIAAIVVDNTFKWFDTRTLKELGSLEMDEVYGSITISPNNKIASVGSYSGARVVDLEKRQVIGYVGGGNGSAFGFTFSKDSQYLAYTVGYRTTGGPYHYINLWSVSTESDAFPDGDFFPTLLDFRYHTMSAPAISPDARLVAAGHSDKRVYVWDLHTGETRFTLEGHGGEVNSVDFSPNGQWLASGSEDGTVRLWNTANGRLVRVITGFRNDVWDVRFAPNGQSLNVSLANWDNYRVDLASNRITRQPETTSTPDPFEVQQYQQGFSTGRSSIFSEVLFSADGKTLATGSQNVLLWDAATHELLALLDNPSGGVLRGMAFNADGSQLAAATDDGRILVWDTKSGNTIFSRKSNFLTGASILYGYGDSEWGPARSRSTVAAQGLEFSPNGHFLAFGNDNVIEIWDVTNDKKVAELANPEGYYATQVSYSADGTRLYAIINRNRIAQIWDTSSNKLVRQVDLTDVDPNAYSAVALQGSLFARNNMDEKGNGGIEVWDLEKGRSILLLTDSAANEPLIFSADGGLLITFGDGSKMDVWNTTTGNLVLQNQFDFYAGGISISSDNRYLAVGNSGKASIFNFEPIAQLAKQPNFQVAIPQATPTPDTLAWPTATPIPTATPSSDSTTVSAPIIDGDNASQVQERARFSKGTIEEIIWSTDDNSILVSGSMGVSEYAVDTSAGGFTSSFEGEHSGWTYHSIRLPNGHILSAGINLGRAYVWDEETGKMLVDLEGGGEPALSPDGNAVVYEDPDGKLVVWDIPNQQTIAALESHSYYSLHPTFSPDGRLVAAVQAWSRYRDSIRVWNAYTGEIVNALAGPDNDITDLSFSADGQYLVGAAGGSAWIWSMHPGAAPEELELYQGEMDGNLNIYTNSVTAAALSPDNRMLAVGTSEHTLELYDRNTQNMLRRLDGHSSSIRKLGFSQDGRFLISVDQDGFLLLWDVSSGERLAGLDDFSGPINGMVYQQKGSLVAWGEGATREIDPIEAEILHTTHIESSGSILAASPTGDLLAVYEPFSVSLLNADNGTLVQKLEGEAEVPFVEYYWEGMAMRRFYAAAFSLDGGRLVTAGAGGVWYYDTTTKRLLQQFPGSNAQKIAISPDGQLMLTSLYEQANPVSAFDLQNGKAVFSLDDTFRGSNVPQAVFSPDGRWVGAVQMAWDEPYKLNIYDVVVRQLHVSLPLSEDIPLVSLAFNPSGNLVAVGRADGEILLIDVIKQETVATLEGHHGAVTHLVFSPDGHYLISGSDDGTVRVWGLP